MKYTEEEVKRLLEDEGVARVAIRRPSFSSAASYRKDDKAPIFIMGSSDVTTEYYDANDQLHREFGAAIEINGYPRSWYIHGTKYYDEQEYYSVLLELFKGTEKEAKVLAHLLSRK